MDTLKNQLLYKNKFPTFYSTGHISRSNKGTTEIFLGQLLLYMRIILRHTRKNSIATTLQTFSSKRGQFQSAQPLFQKTVHQAWAHLCCVRSMIYLTAKKLFPRTENLYGLSIYSLDFYSSTKKTLVPTCDLQTGLIVLGEGLTVSESIKILKISFPSNFESLNPNPVRKNFWTQGWLRNGL